MKIRIKGNSIRFRLTKREVKQLCEHGSVTAATHFEDSAFKYAVVVGGEADLKADFISDTIKLWISKEKIKDWDQNEVVGFESAASETPHLLLEKDFVCLDERSEDQSDNYPNPKMLTE